MSARIALDLVLMTAMRQPFAHPAHCEEQAGRQIAVQGMQLDPPQGWAESAREAHERSRTLSASRRRRATVPAKAGLNAQDVTAPPVMPLQQLPVVAVPVPVVPLQYASFSPLGAWPPGKAAACNPQKEPERPRRMSTHRLVNPRSGEEITIRTSVPFSCRDKRLSILDPHSGKEILPASSSDPSDVDRRESAAEAVKSSLGKSYGSGILCFGNGESWEWPLSRQEKKDRVLMLHQLDLLAELNELKASSKSAAGTQSRRSSTASS